MDKRWIIEWNNVVFTVAQIYKTLIKVLKFPGLYYLICFILMMNLEKQYYNSPPPGDPSLLSIMNAIDWVYMVSFPIIVLIYLNVKSIIKNIFALILIAGAYFISSYLKAFIDYGIGNRHYSDLIFSILSAFSYTIFDFLFILLCAKLASISLNRETILTVLFNIFIIYFVVTNLELVNFDLKIFIHPILFFLLWDYILVKNKKRTANNEVHL